MVPASTFFEIAARNGVDLYTGVPCSFLKPLINYVIDSPQTPYVPLNNEGEAVAYACGAFVAGRRPLVMFQNSGLGNTVNPLTSLAWPSRIPLFVVSTWRGEPGRKDEPQHELMGRITSAMLQLMDVQTEVLGETEDEIAAAFERATIHHREAGLPYGLVVRKDTIEPYSLRDGRLPLRTPDGNSETLDEGDARSRRYDVIERICEIVGEDHVIVGTTGKTGRELFTCRDSVNHWYMVGAMGCASSFALGLAMHVPPHRKVIVIDGDGAALMRMEAMSSIGFFHPSNLIHVLLDNNAHDSTGGQQTLSGRVSFAGVAAACGYPRAVSTSSLDCFSNELERAINGPGSAHSPGLGRGDHSSQNSPTNRTSDSHQHTPALLHVRITPGSLDPLARPDVTPVQVKHRMMEYLGTAPCPV